ncbi:neuraminidase-like domain-containing protein [Pseudomonas sp. Ant30-3]|uniref:Tc toxin subunit A-related protein n=1 Tax=Pseudomonas sp. Ant30-3 TaxID=1488328 RepID=UPI00067B505E|nr:neuraminidase-like domain-containing protein [Pseudomonas sp. Ant30-3]
METIQINELTERYTAAMVDAVLGQSLWPDNVDLSDTDELNDFLMLDTQDRAHLEATWISTDVRCLQQHIQSVYSGMEVGYENSYFEDDDLQYWYQILSHYSTWSANVILKDRAENYIVPALRLKKTALFRTLENNLSQMRLTADSVQRGLMEYTRSFQQICDLDILSGYIDGADVQDARYCLIGRERTSPFAFYWRTVTVDLNNDSKKINPAAWGEWQKIETATAGKVMDIRPLYWRGLPVLVWCEWTERTLNAQGVVQIPWSLEIKMASGSLNGQWSAPVSLHKRECEFDISNGRLTAVSLGDGDPRDDLLAVCYTNRHLLDGESSIQEVEIHETRDALFRKVPGDIATLLMMTFARFRDIRSLQQKVVPADYSKVTMTSTPQPEGGLSKHLFLDAIHTREIGADNTPFEVLRVRGRCDAVEETGRVLERVFIGWKGMAGSSSFEIRIVESGERQLRISMDTREKPTQDILLKLGPEKVLIHMFSKDSFTEESVGDGIWRADAVAKLTPKSLTLLISQTPDEIRAGAGFFVDGLGAFALNAQNQVVQRILYAPLAFSLEFEGASGDDRKKWISTGPLDGQYATPWLTYKRKAEVLGVANFPIDEPIVFSFGADTKTTYGRNQFKVLLNQRPLAYATPSIDKSSPEGAQFLSFNSAQALKHVRVNSTFGPVLTSRAAVSPHALLAWDTQHIDEPPRPDGTIEENGPFDGSNGLYFWELWLHVPDLVGSRLSAEGRHQEAQPWFEYIFNPLAREVVPPENPAPGEPPVLPAPAYWRCRPLQNETIDPSYENAAPTDPDAIGYTAPIHFKIAIILRYLDNLIAWGDSQYRRLDYDSMVAAKLNYSRALSLLGREPDARTATTWAPQTLSSLLSKVQGRDALKAFERDFAISLADVPGAMQATPRFDLLGSDVFLPGINERPKAMWTLLKSRMQNLREGRSIDGRTLSIPLFQTMDPLELLRAQAGGRLGATHNPGGPVQVVPYKWPTVHNLALQGVEFQIQQEEQLRFWLDQHDRSELEELNQSHMLELVDYARSVHKATIDQLEATAASLRQSESMVKARVEHYQHLYDEQVSRYEYEVLERAKDEGDLLATTSGFRVVSAELDIVPNIGGTAFGGARPGAVPQGTADGVYTGAQISMTGSARLSTNEQYRRRLEEWDLVLNQAKAEVRVLSEQILAQEHSIRAAEASLQQTEASNVQAKAVYAFYKNRSSGRELSSWVVGQMKTLIYQAYDLVAGLCLCAETCWQYEMGDFKTRFIRPDVWMDAYFGFTSGHSLKLDLMRMAAARIKRDEHRLQLIKTISLKELKGAEWEASVAAGKLYFSLNQKMFDEDYPGLYCHQIKRVALTFPCLLGPYEHVRAILSQISSTTVIEPDISAIKFLHNEKGNQAPAANVMVRNLRPYQQIALSTGIEDNGAVEPVDDRYAPFEGTGVHADYELTFPRHKTQAAKLASIPDIWITIYYQAKDGGPAFAAVVDKELDTVPEPPAGGAKAKRLAGTGSRQS